MRVMVGAVPSLCLAASGSTGTVEMPMASCGLRVRENLTGPQVCL